MIVEKLPPSCVTYFKQADHYDLLVNQMNFEVEVISLNLNTDIVWFSVTCNNRSQTEKVLQVSCVNTTPRKIYTSIKEMIEANFDHFTSVV